jgi:hypothetical protein
MQTTIPATAPPMTAVKLESSSDFGTTITIGVDRGVVVISRAETNVGASRIAAAGRPTPTSSEFRLSAVRLVDIALAAISVGAWTLVSTRMPVVSKRLSTGRLLFMSRIRSMLTSSLDTPAACEIDHLNLSCALLLNSCLVRGSATAILTTYAAGWGVFAGVVVVVGVRVVVVTYTVVVSPPVAVVDVGWIVVISLTGVVVDVGWIVVISLTGVVVDVGWIVVISRTGVVVVR